MSINYTSGPCYCGALDCHNCHPENFKFGRYIGDDDDDASDLIEDIDVYEPDFDTYYDNPEDDYIAPGYRDAPE